MKESSGFWYNKQLTKQLKGFKMNEKRSSSRKGQNTVR